MTVMDIGVLFYSVNEPLDFGFETFYWFEKTTEGTEDTELSSKKAVFLTA